jgi:hypothetical protein
MNQDAKKKQVKRYAYLKLFGTTKTLLSIAKVFSVALPDGLCIYRDLNRRDGRASWSEGA